MRALTVIPGLARQTRLDDVSEPPQGDGAVLVQTHAIGVCGTDIEIVEGNYGWAPPEQERLIIGHESLGRVLEAPTDSEFSAGDWVVGIVRRPDPIPCGNCAAGEWDMCRNGQYTERGIKALSGFAADRFRTTPVYLVRVDAHLGELGVLLEPTSVVAKGWEHTERIGARALWRPHRLLVTGAGPVGLLAALLGVQRGMEVHILDRATEGLKPDLVRELGATYHCGTVEEAGGDWDVVFECTGAASLFFEVIKSAAPNGIVCLTGVSSGGHTVAVDSGVLNRELVLENNVIFGSVNANRRHYQQAAEALARADQRWLRRLLTRRVPIERWEEAFTKQPDDVKTMLTFT